MLYSNFMNVFILKTIDENLFLTYTLLWFEYLEMYRSGHNELDSKSSCPQGHMGSNPIISANPGRLWPGIFLT